MGVGSWHWYGRCKKCNAISIAQVPSDLFRYYQGGIYYSLKNADTGHAVGKGWKAQLLSKIYFGSGPMWSLAAKAIRTSVKYKHLHATLEIARLAGLSQGASVLDVGCGNRTAFDPLRGLGFTSLDGCDPFIEKTVQRPYGTIFQSEISDLKPNRKYDLILWSHSLEHTEDPARQLSAAARLLTKTGRIAVVIPMGDCAEISAYGACSTLFEAPRHLFLPSRQSMSKLIDECHLSIVETRWHQSMNTLTRSEYISQNSPSEPINFSQIETIENQISADRVEELEQLQAKWHGNAEHAAVGVYILARNPEN